jgi:hypothetical protein
MIKKVIVETPVTTDHYCAVHKGIRLANARMLIALDQADARDEAGMGQVLGALGAHLDLTLPHLAHDGDIVGAVVDLRLMAEDAAMAGADRPAKLRRLCECFAMFVAGDEDTAAGLAGKAVREEEPAIRKTGVVGFMLGA